MPEGSLETANKVGTVLTENLIKTQPGIRTGVSLVEFFLAATEVEEYDETSDEEKQPYISEGHVWGIILRKMTIEGKQRLPAILMNLGIYGFERMTIAEREMAEHRSESRPSGWDQLQG